MFNLPIRTTGCKVAIIRWIVRLCRLQCAMAARKRQRPCDDLSTVVSSVHRSKAVAAVPKLQLSEFWIPPFVAHFVGRAVVNREDAKRKALISRG